MQVDDDAQGVFLGDAPKPNSNPFPNPSPSPANRFRGAPVLRIGLGGAQSCEFKILLTPVLPLTLTIPLGSISRHSLFALLQNPSVACISTLTLACPLLLTYALTLALVKDMAA